MISKELIVLGGGMEDNGLPSSGSVLRAQAAANYYGQYAEDITGIVCCGSYSASMKGVPEGATTEAEWMMGLLRATGVPEGKLIREPKSQTSFETFEEILQQELLDEASITSESPLGIVTVPCHYARVAPIARKALGLKRSEVQNIAVEEDLGLAFRVVQRIGVLVTKVSLIGIPEHDPEGLDKAHKRFARILRRPV